MEFIDLFWIFAHTAYLCALLIMVSSMILRRVDVPGFVGLSAAVGVLCVTAMMMFWLSFLLLPYVAVAKLILLCLFFFVIGKFAWQVLNDKINREIVPPILVFAVLTILLLFIAHADTPISPYLEAVRGRFRDNLPMDNALPLMFLEQLSAGKVKPIIAGDWLVSDRPPLQTALNLLAPGYIVGANNMESLSVSYQTFSVGLQMLYVLAAWVICRALGAGPLVSLGGMVLVFFMPVTFHNGVFVWPKLLGSALVGFFFAIHFWYLKNANTLTRLSPWYGGLAGLMVVLSMLSHGTQVFALTAIFLVSLITVRRFGYKYILAAAAVCLVMYIPWMIFQSEIAPPGDRLLKWHLAGQIAIDDRGLLETLIDSYSALSWEEFWGRRKNNFSFMFLHFWDSLVHSFWLVFASLTGNTAVIIRSLAELRVDTFFYLTPSMGILGFTMYLLPFGLLLTAYRPYVLVVVLSLVFWNAASFASGGTVVHQGTMFFQLITILLFYIVSLRFLKYLWPVYGLQILLTLILFAPPSMSRALFDLTRKDFGIVRPSVSLANVLDNDGFVGFDYDRTNFYDAAVLGSHTVDGGDTQKGSISITIQRGDSLYYRTGPVNERQIIRLIFDRGEKALSIPDVTNTWSRLDFNGFWIPESFEVVIEDNGDGWGEWSAIAIKPQ